ncbi:MAG: hypothetical protein HY435_01990 [Candidatus Liptonbacteria bacterium]|nr:hypothetical protein [Candidatus Liptonbacteria bacterium]
MERKGFSLIDLVLTLGIITLLFGGIFLVYFTILDVLNNSSLRTIAVSVLNREIEIIRNLPYENVGTVGGVPAGILPQEQAVSWSDINFTLRTVIRNIDDPFDGTLGGAPNDTAPADYKLIELEASCGTCGRFVPILITTTVAPQNLESTSRNGSLFVNVFDAFGLPIENAQVRVVNTSVSPSIDLTDSTNINGVFQLVDVPTSTLSYELSVSKAGFSSEKTFPPGAPGNPNPLKPHATVAEQTVTSVSFAIDRTSTIQVKTHDATCSPFAGKSFTLSGTKLIGTSPDVLKFSTTSATDASGTRTFGNIEWDTYNALLSDSLSDVLGTIPLFPTVVNPASTGAFSFVLLPSAPNALLITVKNAVTGGTIGGSTTTLSSAGFSETKVTGRSFVRETDWSGGSYSSQSGGVETESAPGSFKLAQESDGRYSTTTTSWLVSQTINVGSSTATYYSLAWNPLTEPPATGPGSARFQIASNNDQATWNFTGPDGTPGTYYSASGEVLHGQHNGNRYVRYKAYLMTASEFATPQVDDVSIEFNSVCVPPSQVLFQNLSPGAYTITAVAPGYAQATSSVSVSGAWQQQELLLPPL